DQRFMADVLAEVLNLDEVSVEDNFFDDLGANSLLMARFCARLRTVQGWEMASMRDIYLHPSITGLAKHLHLPQQSVASVTEQSLTHKASNFAYWTCGAAQLAFYAIY